MFCCLVVWLFGCLVDWLIGTVFQTAPSLFHVIPETSSRVTLATLGIGFQPNLPTKNYTTRLINNYTTRLINNYTTRLINNYTTRLINYYTTRLINNYTTRLINYYTTRLINNYTTRLINNDTTRQRTCLEDSTERSESNPGRSLGIYKAE